jgi:hypothetical protein
MLRDTGKSRKQIGENKTAKFLEVFKASESYRTQYEEQAIEWYKQLVGYKEETEDEKQRRENGEPVKSNLHIPRTYQIVDTIRARMVMALFHNKPYVDFIPIPSDQMRIPLQQAEEKADIASSLVNQQLEKNDISAKFYDFVTSLLVFPLGVMGVGWRYEEDVITKKVPQPELIQTPMGPQYTGNLIYQAIRSREKIWDDNEITNIDFFDFWPDPKGTDIDDCRFVWQREFITYEDLVQMLQYLDYLDEGEFYIDSLKELDDIKGSMELKRGREDRLSEVGYTDNMPDLFSNSKDESMKKNAEFELLHYWEDNRHAILINRDKLIYDGPSPYWRHRKKPFITATYDRLPNQLYGLSAVQIISDLQEEENTIHNQRSDNVNFIINKMWKIRRGADIDESELVSQPGGIVHVDNPDDIDPFDMPDVAASSFQQQNIISTVMENTLGTPPVIRGAASRGDQTATETIKQSTNAGMRFDIKIELFRSLGVKRLAYLMDMNNQQFIDDTRLVGLDMNGAMQWREIPPGQLIGEFDYRTAAANVDPAANKQVRREQLGQMMTFLMQAQIPFVDYHNLIKEWLQSFDIENAEKFLIPMDQWQQMAFMIQKQMEEEGEGGGDRPTQSQQEQNKSTGRARGRRPQSQRLTDERKSGAVR